MKWRGHCDGYTDSDVLSTAERQLIATRALRSTSSKAKTDHIEKPPLLITEPPVNTIRFSTDEQCSYFREWSALSTTFLSGGLAQTRLWTATMPQVTLDDRMLRFGAMAVGALRKASDSDRSGTSFTVQNRHYFNAITFYCEALRLQSKASPTREGLRTALLSSLLFICFESLRADVPAALKHMVHGFSMLNELAACSDKAPDLVSIAPAPPAMVQEILECYKPLELQSRSFMGSYRKFFFPPSEKQPSRQGAFPASGLGQGVAAAPGAPSQDRGPMPTTLEAKSMSPESQPGTPWAASPSNFGGTGLISPQSQAGSPGPPRRPPGIAPFTRHSPYFRPKMTHIHSLDHLPQSFRSFDEAQGYWALVQRQMVKSIPLLTATTAQLALHRAASDAEVAQKLNSVKQNEKIAAFIAESRYWLQRWIVAFDLVYKSACHAALVDEQSYLHAVNLRIEYLILYIYTTIPRFSDLDVAQGLTPQYHEITILAEILLAARPNGGFAMDSGWSWPLFVSAFACRDPAVKDIAIRILTQYPMRNTLRDSRIFRAIALKNQEVELENLQEGTGDEQWLRLRRRELVFEDFGANIIFRNARKNYSTGAWELVEEVAAFELGPNGELTWQRQAVTDSASILSGVC